MASEIEICNVALSHIGKYPIDSLNDRTKEAVECKRLYPRVRDSVMRDHPWNFATKRLTLAALTEEVEGFDYVYQWPSDCLRALKIYNPADEEEEIVFEIGVSNDLSTRVILTDQEDAILIYVARVTNPNVYDTVFIDALAYRLASELAIPLAGDPNLGNAMARMYSAQLGRAQMTNSNERYKGPDTRCSFIDARA